MYLWIVFEWDNHSNILCVYIYIYIYNIVLTYILLLYKRQTIIQMSMHKKKYNK